ncbi:MAG: hypothetical protein L0312_20215 [Acidobacteria bacterium]|nr:hypothetical protein [Acidobacteriota bacterium]
MNEPEPRPVEQPLPFDAAACERIRNCFAEVLLRHPEVRSLSATIDYYGALNDAKINHGVWIGANGAVEQPDAIFGSLFQTLKILNIQLERGLALTEHLREQAQVLGAEVVKRHEELKGSGGARGTQVEPSAGPPSTSGAETHS